MHVIGFFSRHSSLTLVLPLKNTAFRDAWGTEHRQDLSPWQRLLWAAWHPDSIVGGGGERETEKERREKGGCGIRQPHFSPLGLCGLLVFTCRISIKTENVRETERYIKTKIRARDRHRVLGVCRTHVLLVSQGSECSFSVWDQDQTHTFSPSIAETLWHQIFGFQCHCNHITAQAKLHTIHTSYRANGNKMSSDWKDC